MKLYISAPSSHKKCMAKAARISSFPKQPHAMKVREFTKRTRVHKSLTYPNIKGILTIILRILRKSRDFM